MMDTYSLAEIRNGTGWRPLQRFVTLDDLTNEIRAILSDLRRGKGDPLAALAEMIGEDL